MTRPRERYSVPVAGGDLAVHRWPADGPTVLAAHGITSNGLSWSAVADALPGFEIIAPDLRGRAGSRSLPGPYGPARHADDLLGVLDHRGVAEPVVLAGHSMGGFVASVAAAAHPERFSKLVLVDGGLAFPEQEGADIDAVLEAVIGPAMRRLSMEFADLDAYHEFWHEHPAFTAIWHERTIECLDHDLIGEPPQLRSSCVLDAIRTDGAGVLADPEVLGAIHRLTVPAVLLWAQRGMLDQPEGIYSPDRLAALPDGVRAELVPEVNHYSILFGDNGAKAVAAAIAS
ncbi:MAG TPA: alpha/beta hydrolase [Pseudonocardiaceae bacterium]|nr:alpha/beta hydrolase [Pseudonocardiaceae bacterium]